MNVLTLVGLFSPSLLSSATIEDLPSSPRPLKQLLQELCSHCRLHHHETCGVPNSSQPPAPYPLHRTKCPGDTCAQSVAFLGAVPSQFLHIGFAYGTRIALGSGWLGHSPGPGCPLLFVQQHNCAHPVHGSGLWQESSFPHQRVGHPGHAQRSINNKNSLVAHWRLLKISVHASYGTRASRWPWCAALLPPQAESGSPRHRTPPSHTAAFGGTAARRLRAPRRREERGEPGAHTQARITTGFPSEQTHERTAPLSPREAAPRLRDPALRWYGAAEPRGGARGPRSERERPATRWGTPARGGQERGGAAHRAPGPGWDPRPQPVVGVGERAALPRAAGHCGARSAARAPALGWERAGGTRGARAAEPGGAASPSAAGAECGGPWRGRGGWLHAAGAPWI